MNITIARIRSNVKYNGPLETVLDSYFEGFNSFLFPIAAKALALNPLAAPLIANVNKIANKTKGKQYNNLKSNATSTVKIWKEGRANKVRGAFQGIQG